MYIRTKIVEPYILRVSFFTASLLLEKEHVCFHSIRIKYPCRKTENSVKITVMKNLLTDNLSCTSLKKHIIWKDYGCPSVHLEERVNMLDKIQLFIARGGPEVRSFDTIIIFSFFSVFCREFMSTLRPKRWICENDFVS